MKRSNFIQLLSINVIALLLTMSCERPFMEGNPDYDAQENFEYLWKQVDEKYSYFDQKNINWDSVYNVYAPIISQSTSEYTLFSTLFEMLGLLKDGHVNLVSSFNVSRYNISHNAPENFNWRLIKDYYLEPGTLNHFNVQEHSYATGSLRHQIFTINNTSVGYIYYSSFSNPISNYDIELTLSRMSNTKGLIIDVRNNGGGAPSNIFQIINRLTSEKRYIYGSRIKTGKAHNDFGELMEVYSEPEGNYKYTKPIVILTNRNCFSATSFFAAACKAFPNITLVGDTTGGGAGAPHGGQMPNGWYYRFSVTRSGYPMGDTLYDFENGVPPDIHIDMDINDELNGIDTMIDKAIELLLTESSAQL